MIYDKESLKQLGTIMGIWAHPDDETWSSAGIMAAAVENGQDVHVLSATKGDAGKTADENSWAQNKLKHIREAEFKQALQAVGVEKHTMLNYPDGRLDSADTSGLLEEIKQLITSFSPDTILTFEKNGITGHGDHRTISELALKAARAVDKTIAVYGVVETKQTYESVGKEADELFNVYFAIDEPVLYDHDSVELCFRLPPHIQEKKRAAMAAHASQTSGMFKDPIGKRLVAASLEKECFIKLQ